MNYRTHTLIAILAIFFFACSEREAKNDTPKVSPAYVMEQRIFCLNTLSNISGHFNYMTADSISNFTATAINNVLADTGIRNLIGNWKCAWGPVVLSSSPSNPDSAVANNTMYIAQSLDSPGLYVVAIAGTNPASSFDWASEDADFLLKEWPYATHVKGLFKVKPKVTRGTLTGLTILQNMVDTNLKQTAFAFLNGQSQANKAITVWVTGHSLGGALSPAYALFLSDSITFQAWNGPVNVYCMPVAGATPGNDSFSNYYSTRLGNNTIRVWNTLDVVPHAYNYTMLGQISTLYMGANPPIVCPKQLADTITYIQTITRAYGNYMQLLPSNQGFKSNYYTNAQVINQGTLNTDTFTVQAVCQHIPAYADYFGISAFQARTQAVMNNSQPAAFMKMSTPFFSFGLTAAGIDSGAVNW